VYEPCLLVPALNCYPERDVNKCVMAATNIKKYIKMWTLYIA